MTTELWAGSFGTEYTLRNLDVGAGRGAFWRRLLTRYSVTSVLEVGCNVGANLQHIAPLWVTRVAGCDVNQTALSIARKRLGPHVELRHDTIEHAGYAAQSFELVVSCGLLIHVPPVHLPKVMDTMWRISSKYLLIIEYHANEEEEVEYRGQRAALWKRPYNRLFYERFALTSVARGFLGRADGFDNVHWDLWRKRP